MWLQESLIFWIAYLEGVHKTDLKFRNPLRFQYHEATSEILSNLHQASVVFKHPAVIRSAENGYQLPISEELVSVINH